MMNGRSTLNSDNYAFQNPHPSTKVPEFKIILVGNSGVGKTCVVARAAKDIYHEQNPTIGFAFQKLHKTIDDQKISLFIWDTAGQERYRSIIQMYYRGAQGAVIVYDVTNEESFEAAKTLVIDLKRNEYLYDTYFVLVGNKTDCQRAVSSERGKEYANSQDLAFAEVSAKTGEGIHELFENIASQMVQRHLKHLKRFHDESNMTKNIKIGSSDSNYNIMSENRCSGVCYGTQ